MRRLMVVLLAALLLANVCPALAQGGGDDALPPSALLTGIRHEYQGWNNCGPATLTMGLSFFGWSHDQYTAANWLKPDPEDKNVSPWQMAEFVNTQTPVRALVRYGGTLDTLRRLIANDFPILIEAGFEPEGYDWMGHYELIVGYDDGAGTFTTQDSFLGPNRTLTQQDVDHYWRHFNRVYIVLYAPEREAELLVLLGADADEQANAARALETARQEAIADQSDPFAWFNMGTSYLLLGMYPEAAIAYDQARNAGPGLPWRILWYQFGMLEAYYQVGRYDDVLALVEVNLGTTTYVEETYYYAGLARAARGETDRAIANFQAVLAFNPHFTPARTALDQLLAGQGDGA